MKAAARWVAAFTGRPPAAHRREERIIGVPSFDPRPVQTRAGLVNVRAGRWVRASKRGERQLQLAFWAAPCAEVSHVDISYGATAVVVTLHEGYPPEQVGRPCVQMAEYRSVDVALSEDIAGREIRDGGPTAEAGPS